jgi:hypothetical protein
VGVDLLPTPNGGFLVLELNGAVDFRPVYSPLRDVFFDAVDALLEDAVRQPSSPRPQSEPYGCGSRPVSTSRRPSAS